MRRGLLACALVLAVPLAAQAATGIGGWWQTPDQRGAALLRKGDAAGAAQHFRDPRWRAYAQIKAGDYQAAAQGLAVFDDADAHYNRGNALARTGDLQGALAAYDAALAKDSHDMDARHNRDLVAKALQNRQSPTGSAGKSGEQGSSKQGEPSGQMKRDGKTGESQPEDGKQSTQQGRGEHEPRDGSAVTNSGTKPQGVPARQNNGTSKDQSRESWGAQAQQDTESSKNGDDQAKSNAQSATRRAGAAPPPQVAQAGAAAADSPPRTESQLALDQWLRRLPDDPAGLLRRKFMIEHLMRQQEAQQ